MRGEVAARKLTTSVSSIPPPSTSPTLLFFVNPAPQHTSFLQCKMKASIFAKILPRMADGTDKGRQFRANALRYKFPILKSVVQVFWLRPCRPEPSVVLFPIVAVAPAGRIETSRGDPSPRSAVRVGAGNHRNEGGWIRLLASFAFVEKPAATVAGLKRAAAGSWGLEDARRGNNGGMCQSAAAVAWHRLPAA